MSMTPEGKVKQDVKKALDAISAVWFMPPASTYGRAGISDIIACLGGRTICIETKARGRRPSPLQLRFLRDWAAHGATAMIVWPDRVRMFGADGSEEDIYIPENERLRDWLARFLLDLSV